MTFIALCLATFLALLGCETPGGGGSSGGAVAEAAIAVDPVHLAPGQTTAQLAWPASDGPIDNYLVFESRNGSGYTFSAVVNDPTAVVSGSAGDSVQITVIGVSPTGEVSESSPPSPPLIFYPPVAAAVAAPTPGGASPMTTPAPASMELAETSSATGDEAMGDALAAAPTDPEASDNTTEEPQEATLLARTIRSLLLGSDARLPESGLSSAASQWLQGQVDQEIAAGVSLAGTGRGNDDALREVVWLDQAGQLFVSDGQNFLESDDLPSTFDEALRLGATERFIGLADFDGDGRGDWLIEDTATGEVWMIDGVTDQTSASSPSVLLEVESRLAGLGDFDGDGLSELLWIGTDNRLRVTGAGSGAETMGTSAVGPEDFELLAIADLDGNGRDDLLGRNADGSLSMALAVETDSETGDAVVLEWHAGTTELSDELDLVATLDVDEDGAAEIAWLNGDDTLEIWDATSGRESSIGL